MPTYGAVPVLDVSASYDVEREVSAVFIVNRSLEEIVTTDIVWQDFNGVKIDQAWQIAGANPKEENSWEKPNRLVAKSIPAPAVDHGRATIALPPLSFTVLTTNAN